MLLLLLLSGCNVLWDVSSLTRDRTPATVMRAQIPTHWTAREFLVLLLKHINMYCYKLNSMLLYILCILLVCYRFVPTHLLCDILVNMHILCFYVLYIQWYLISLVLQSCLILCEPMDCSTPGFSVHRQLPELSQIHVHWVGGAIQPSHPLLSPSPPNFNLSQHQGLLQWVSSLH